MLYGWRDLKISHTLHVDIRHAVADPNKQEPYTMGHSYVIYFFYVGAWHAHFTVSLTQDHDATR